MIDFETLQPRGEGPTVPLPIVPDDGLYLYDPGIFRRLEFFVTPSNVTRQFIRCFQKVWNRLPEPDKGTLKTFWKPLRSDARGGMPFPVIGFNLMVMPRRLAAACRGGHELNFDVFFVARSKPSAITHVIAHELAHAISYPHGWASQHECVANRGTDCVACECRAFSYMAAWGFDPFFDVLPKRKHLLDRFRGVR